MLITVIFCNIILMKIIDIATIGMLHVCVTHSYIEPLISDGQYNTEVFNTSMRCLKFLVLSND